MICAILPLSALNYWFIEQPFRNKNCFSQKQIFHISGLASLITLVLALLFIQTGNNQSLAINNEGDPYLSDLKNYGNSDYVIGNYNILAEKRTFSNETSKLNRRLALIGDSFSQDFYNIIIEGKYFINYEIRVYFIFSHC
jgi:hypothetical protein